MGNTAQWLKDADAYANWCLDLVKARVPFARGEEGLRGFDWIVVLDLRMIDPRDSDIRYGLMKAAKAISMFATCRGHRFATVTSAKEGSEVTFHCAQDDSETFRENRGFSLLIVHPGTAPMDTAQKREVEIMFWQRIGVAPTVTRARYFDPDELLLVTWTQTENGANAFFDALSNTGKTALENTGGGILKAAALDMLGLPR